MGLSVIIITKNSAEVLERVLESLEGLWDELLVSDEHSNDKTDELVKKYGGAIFYSRETNLGKRKQWLVKRVKKDWVLVLDSDEEISPELYKEIQNVVTNPTKNIIGYNIPYQNYVFGKPVYLGGEHYSKIRLFRRGYGRITLEPVHCEVVVKGIVNNLKGVIHHHSYRSKLQLFKKFTFYAWVEAGQKLENKETLSLRKLLLYGPHMFWARFIEEQGWRDGWRGFVLATAFGYMEWLTYTLLLWRTVFRKK